MNEPRNEMTNEAARLVLHSYRPNGIDARDPRFRAALDQAAHDPDLARWLNQHAVGTSGTTALHALRERLRALARQAGERVLRKVEWHENSGDGIEVKVFHKKAFHRR